MSDVEAVQQEGANDLVDLERVRVKYVELVDGGQMEHGLMLLDQLSRWPDSTRYLRDNLWLYGKLGDLNRVLEHEEDAMAAYPRGFELDPREREILEPYSEMLFEHHKSKEGLRVMQALLLHHKRALPPQELVAIYRRLGAFYEAIDRPEKARTSYEKALEQLPSDTESLVGLLRVVAQVGDPMAVIRVRQKLIRNLESEQARSHALVALGDDWIYAFNDPWRALDVFEQAVIEYRENKTAMQRLATVGSEVGDWRRASRAFFTLSSLAEEPAEKADWIIKASFVARDELWEADSALTGFKKALELDPTRLDAFKAVTSLLYDAKNWEQLEIAYVQLISSNVEIGNDSPQLMTILWKNLAELYKTHLKRPGDAVFAYEQAVVLTPSIELHEAVAELAEDDSEHFDTAIQHLRAIYKLDPSRWEALDRMGRVFLRMKDVDSAWCMFRAIKFMGHALDAKAQAFVDRFDTALFRPIKRQFAPHILSHHIYTAGLDPAITDIFRIVKKPLEEWVGESLSKHGLRQRRDRVKLDEPLAFNRIYKSIGHTLGYQHLPELWHKSTQHGLVNGALVPEGMIAGDDILGSGREEYSAFVVGKQLFLFLAPFYLGAIRPLGDLQVFLILAVSLVRPDVKIDMTKEMENAMKRIRKSVKGPALAQLRSAVQKISDREADIGKWLEAVEDSANRVGLLFCDDLDAAREYLRTEPQPIGGRSVNSKMESLVEYSISEKYFELREKLGIRLHD